MTSRRVSGTGRLSALAAAAASLLLLAGCTSSGTRPPSTPPPPTPASSDYVDAIEHTRSLGTASVTIAVETTEGGATARQSGSGAVAFYDGHGDVLWQESDGSVRRERSNGRGVFVQDVPPDGPWRRAEPTPPTAALADPLRGLGQVSSPRRIGSAVIDGRSADVYAGTVGASAEQLDLLALGPAERTALPADAADLVVEVTVWIDGAGRLLRIDRRLAAAEGGTPEVLARVSTTLSDFSRVIDLSSPPGFED